MTTPTDGVVVVDKPADWTSHDVVARMRRIAGTRRVGHAGTLDPMATGVLVVGLGRATKLLGYLAAHDKEYDATMRLGVTTTTDDADGEEVARADDARVTDDELSQAVARFVGDIDQVPSSVSAIKVGLRDNGPDNTETVCRCRHEGGPSQSAAQDLLERERTCPPQVTCNLIRPDARSQQAPGCRVHSRRRDRVLKRPGIGHEPDVEQRRRRLVERGP